ncbi:outer membrane beta-barrel protein [Massilia niabensis]|uniref:Outer membrane beta-barrel protein n=1 Tax=Massilia niabensis TaxID=544910 RepID=A0ABW0L9Z3_9BURK
MKKIALAFSLAAVSMLGTAHAQTYEVVQPIEARPLRFVFGAGFTFGGDKLATAVYDDGVEIDIDAGAGLAMHVGVDYRVSPQFSVQGTVGYHVDSANAWNGDLRFERVPFELLGYYHVNDKVRAGGGLRFVTNAALRCSGACRFGDTGFDDTTSAVAELEYLYTPRVGFKLRYVNEQFKEKDWNYKVKGDHVGLLANFYF